MQTQLSSSPLSILSHEFVEIHLEASSGKDPSAPLGIQLGREWGPSTENPLDWRLSLTVRFGGKGDKDGPPPYHGHLKVIGYFEVAESYPEDKRDSLIGITGASILYGACREMLANLTARGPHGLVSLPSISFLEPDGKKAAKKATRKAAAKSAPKKKAAKKKTAGKK